MQAEAFVEAVRKVVRSVRYGSRELVLATIGALFLGLPKLLPEAPEPLKPLLVWIPWLGVPLLILAVWRIWRKAVAPLPEGKPKPAAIKGPAPFGPQDAELFARLGRNEDLDRLRGWILDDQKPLVALMGESGVGKTSLLRAGLASHLKGDGIPVIYWEALPTDPEAGLLHAVRSAWGDPAAAPASFQDLSSAIAAGMRVVVIDQAEQLSPERHGAVFELLRQAASANPPYAATWVVAFRREYLPVWRDFELGLPEPVQRRLETLSLRRFLPDTAERVVAVLADEGGVPVEQRVVKALVESVAVEGRVAPADIGISLLVLSELSGEGGAATFSLDDFREGGGQAGLLTRYLERLLEPFPEAERRDVLRGLLSLIDLDKDQRLAEGRTLRQLEESVRPASAVRFEAALKFLASGKARVLEEVPEPPPRYRLVHERLIPAIRRLTGVLLAEAEQASLLLERAYRTWSRDRRSRYLLFGQDLRQVSRFRDQLAWGEDADQKRTYVRLSLRQRGRLWASAAMALGILGVGIHFYSEHQSQEATYRNLLESWKIPPDLLDRLDQIEELTLPESVTRVDWLRKARRLRSLTIEGGALASLEGLPEGLRSLKVGRSPLRTLPRLPASLVSLQIDINGFSDLKGLPANLLALTVEGAKRFDPSQFPPTLQVLSLQMLSFEHDPDRIERLDLRHLKHLRVLFLGGGAVGKLALPGRLQSLSLAYMLVDQVESMPGKLDFFRCLSCDLHLPESMSRNLRYGAFTVDERSKVAAVPLNVRDLSINYDYLPQLAGLPLPNLDSLHIVRYASVPEASPGAVTLSQFPSTLKALEIQRFGLGGDLELHDLPKDLAVLTVFGAVRLPEGLPKSLRTFTFQSMSNSDVPELPSGLALFTYSGLAMPTELPASLRSLSIGGPSMDTKKYEVLAATIARLKILSRLKLGVELPEIPGPLPALTDLDIHRARIGDLHKLPPNLISLTLNPGQLENLKNVPESVTALHFQTY